MWNISATTQQRSLLQSVCSIQCCRAAAHCSRSHYTDHVKRGAFRASGLGEKTGLHSPCQHERESLVFQLDPWLNLNWLNRAETRQSNGNLCINIRVCDFMCTTAVAIHNAVKTDHRRWCSCHGHRHSPSLHLFGKSFCLVIFYMVYLL